MGQLNALDYAGAPPGTQAHIPGVSTTLTKGEDGLWRIPGRSFSFGASRMAEYVDVVLTLPGSARTRSPEDRPSLFADADALTAGDRMDDYGSPGASFERIASFWSAYLGVEIHAHQVATMMTLLKISRSVTSDKRDSYVDMAAYVKLAHELREGA